MASLARFDISPAVTNWSSNLTSVINGIFSLEEVQLSPVSTRNTDEPWKGSRGDVPKPVV